MLVIVVLVVIVDGCHPLVSDGWQIDLADGWLRGVDGDCGCLGVTDPKGLFLLATQIFATGAVVGILLLGLLQNLGTGNGCEVGVLAIVRGWQA